MPLFAKSPGERPRALLLASSVHSLWVGDALVFKRVELGFLTSWNFSPGTDLSITAQLREPLSDSCSVFRAGTGFLRVREGSTQAPLWKLPGQWTALKHMENLVARIRLGRVKFKNIPVLWLWLMIGDLFNALFLVGNAYSVLIYRSLS